MHGKITNTISRRGAVAILVLVSLAVIIGIVAIVVDGGRMMEERRQLQTVADAAALAGAADLYANWNSNHGVDVQGTAAAATNAIAASNGLAANALTINIPPTTGSFAGKAGYVEVIASANLSATFGQIFTGTPVSVVGRSVARGMPLKFGIVLLQPSGPNAFYNQSTGVFTVVSNPIVVNSSDPASFNQASVGAFIASEISVVGGISNSGGSLLLGTVRTNATPWLDPLAFLPIPGPGLLTRSATPLTINSIVPTVLQPGIYNGGINIKGVSVVTMQPGTYVMQGGGFSVDGASTVSGLNVTIYNTTSSTYPTGAIGINSLGTVLITSPTSGSYQGISIFQDRTLANTISISALGISTTLNGMIYGANAPVVMVNGGSTVNVLGGGYVAYSMHVSGAGAGVNVDILSDPPRVPDVRTVE